MTNYIQVLRVKQWLKNALILFPAFFGQEISNLDTLWQLALAVLGFCFVAGSIYIFNDVADIERDQKHPVKRLKPIASGKIPVRTAVGFGVALLLIGASIIGSFSWFALGLVGLYVAINLTYSYGLKKVPILDLLLVSSGFLIRILIGGEVAAIAVSPWLLTLTTCAALFILLAKRRDDVLLFQKNGVVTRDVVRFYSKFNFTAVLYIAAASTLVTYSAYTFSPTIIEMFGSEYVWITQVFAALGLFRFTHLVLNSGKPFEPIQLILSDWVMLLALVLWIVSFGFLIYV